MFDPPTWPPIGPRSAVPWPGRGMTGKHPESGLCLLLYLIIPPNNLHLPQNTRRLSSRRFFHSEQATGSDHRAACFSTFNPSFFFKTLGPFAFLRLRSAPQFVAWELARDSTPATPASSIAVDQQQNLSLFASIWLRDPSLQLI